MILLRVSKTVSIDLEDLSKIQELIKKGKTANLSEFVQNAIKKQLEEDRDV